MAGRLGRLLGRSRDRIASAPGMAEARSPAGLAVVTAAATVAAGVAGVAVRRLLTAPPDTVGSLAQATAVSVWDAAKGTVIERVREAGDRADVAVVRAAARAAVREAASEGADITAAAVGAADGAVSVAGLLAAADGEVLASAATAAIEAAREVGPGAAARVEEALAGRFGEAVRAAG